MKPSIYRKDWVLLLVSGLLLLSGCSAALRGIPGDSGSGAVFFGNVERDFRTAETAEARQEGTAALETAASRVCVYVCGAVEHPGVYLLPEGARLYQAVEAAGGFVQNADPEALNLAAPVRDGEQVRIRFLGEETDAGNTAQPSDGRISLNRATREELMRLPGIGEARADAILAYREKHGPFQNPEDIMMVPGIKNSAYEKLKDYIITD